MRAIRTRIVVPAILAVSTMVCTAEQSAQTVGSIDFEEGRKFWSFQPLATKDLPPHENTKWPKNRIDSFVLACLEQHGLRPSRRADRRTLIRRLSFGLIGLPPAPEEVSAFLQDDSPDAYHQLIDRLLSSPHYGERWGRVWLDLARYTDVRERWVTTYASPHLYRDWVVRALNEDLPYDQFVKRQLATDLMEETGLEDMPALGFLGVSPVYHKELMAGPDVIKPVVAEEWEERVDTVGRTFLGLTLACARCHDHKSDPIDTRDYYALAGVFASIRRYDRAVLPDGQARVAREARKEVAGLEKEIRRLRELKEVPADLTEQVSALEKRIGEIVAATPHYHDAWVPAVIESSIQVVPKDEGTKLAWQAGEPRDLELQVGGDPAKLGPVVKRRFLRVLSGDDPEPFQQGSGRLELAECLFDEGAALAARVMVNRVWLQHFGRGLVTTPSDFGREGARPSHPELLDDLAARFVEHGWSLKWLHREIVNSATFRQSSAHEAEMARIDPDNRWLWRMNRRRLEVEGWRDAMLTVAGRLDLVIGGPPLELSDPENCRRTIYGKIERRDLEPVLQLYDFPDPSTHSPARETTTTPLQQLFALNGEFIQRQAAALVERLHRAPAAHEAARVRLAYRLLYAREPGREELELAHEFLSGAAEESNRRERWRQYAQVLLGSNEFFFVD